MFDLDLQDNYSAKVEVFLSGGDVATSPLVLYPLI